MSATPWCTALFVGGPKDGERMVILEEHPYIRVATKNGFWNVIETFEYCLVMTSKVRGFALYAAPGMDEEAIFRKLLEGYNPR